jgi:hypothetical protein
MYLKITSHHEYNSSAFFIIVGVSLEGASRTEDGAIELKRGASKGLQLFFESLHIKYGNSVGGVGSEHLLDGKSYDMELQFLFSYRGIDDEQPYYFTLARQLNDLFPYRDKMVQIVSVFVQVDPVSYRTLLLDYNTLTLLLIHS